MVGYKITIKNKDDAVKAKSIDDLVIEQFCLDLISAQEYFDIDLMPEIMAIAKKIGATNEVEDIIEEESK